jgi:hypothetical protein
MNQALRQLEALSDDMLVKRPKLWGARQMNEDGKKLT